jgi:hypothetical protein
LAPITWLTEKLIPASAIKGVLDGANWLAESLADTGDICRDGGVTCVSELISNNLELSDKLADEVHNSAIGIAAAEGGATGFGGIFMMAADIPTIITLALRTVHKIGLCYGYECNTPKEKEFVFGVLSASGANSVEEKIASLAALRSIQTTVAKQTWKALAKKATANQFSKEGGIIAVKNLAKQLGINLTKRKTLQAIPVIGCLVGASVNGWYIKDVGWAARRSFQERWLSDNGKLVEIA